MTTEVESPTLQKSTRLSIFVQNSRQRYRQFLIYWRDFRRQPLGMIGILIIVMFGLMVPAQPLLINTIWDRKRYDPYIGFDVELMPHPTGPSADHILGTDGLGRDIFSQLLYGSQNSFRVGITAALLAVTISTIIGAVAGFFGGVWDAIIMGVTDVFVLVPPLIVLLIFGLIVRMNWWMIGLIFGILTGLGQQAIVVKSQTLSIKNRPFIEAARIAGGGNLYILRKHILPSLLPISLVHMVMTVVGAVLTESLLSYFSRTQDYMSWGSMIWIGQRIFRWFTIDGQWNTILPPAFSIILFCSAFYFVGRSLDDVLNPKLRKP